MPQREKKISTLRRPFVMVGAAIGAVLAGWYLCSNFGRAAVVPDPVWTRFVNVALLMFSPIYLANLLRHLAEPILRRK